MINACPSCGAVYNVAAKDIGRKIKCKKCSSPLVVTDAGLVYDSPQVGGAVGFVPATAVVADDFGMDDPPPARGRRAVPSVGSDAVGLFATLLFTLGTFMVIVFAFMPVIGKAADDRAEALVEKLTQERDAKLKKLLPKGKTVNDLTSDEQKRYLDDSKKITEEYEKKLSDAADDARSTKTSNKRSVWMERYGLMFGFLFLAFGCIGYLRTEQPLVMRIVAAVVLCFALMVIFAQSVGGGCGAVR